MRKIYNYILTVCFALSATTCNAQVTVKLSQLAGTTWKTIKPNDTKIERMWTFSSKVYKQYRIYTFDNYRKSPGVTYPFYLDSIYSFNFEHSKVGVSKKGCYIHEYNANKNYSDIWVIESFDDDKGIMTITKKINTDAPIVIGTNTITLVLKRIQ